MEWSAASPWGKRPRMNVQRGALRLWIVVSVLWIE